MAAVLQHHRSSISSNVIRKPADKGKHQGLLTNKKQGPNIQAAGALTTVWLYDNFDKNGSKFSTLFVKRS